VRVLVWLVYVRAVGGEIGATSALAPKLGPLKLVRIYLASVASVYPTRRPVLTRCSIIVWLPSTLRPCARTCVLRSATTAPQEGR